MYHKRRVERKERQFIPLDMPPSRACSICKNRMNDICLDDCAPNESYRYFEPNMKMDADLFPKLSIEEYRELNGKMKGEWLFVQQTKLMEVQNGTNGRYFNSARSRRVSKALQEQNLPDGATEQNPLRQDREERKDQEERPIEVDRNEQRKVPTT